MAQLDLLDINGNFEKKGLGKNFSSDLIKFGKNLHDESKRLNKSYEFKEIDFFSKTMKQQIEEMYN